MQVTEGFIKVDGGKIFYRSVGEGRPILVMHGGPGLDQSYLQPQIYKLAENAKLIFHDQRGAGKSLGFKIDPDNINIDKFVDDIEQLRISLGLEKFILMGHSWGGFLSMRYAVKYQENLEALILVSTLPADHEGFVATNDSFMAKTLPVQNKLGAWFSYDEFHKLDSLGVAELYRDIFSTYVFDHNVVNEMNIVFDLEAARNGFKVDEVMMDDPCFAPGASLFPDLQSMRVPTLVLHGKQDFIPIATAEKIAKAINNSKFMVLENCGHFPYVETPEAFEEAVNTFIAGLDK